MKLLDHIIDTIKEWQMKMGEIDSDIRLYYPPDSICEILSLPEGTDEEGQVKAVKEYLGAEGRFLGDVQVIPAKDHRIGIVIPKEGSRYVAENVPDPEFLSNLLKLLKDQDMQAIKNYFRIYAEEHQDIVLEEKEDDGIGTVLGFGKEETDPYMYCFDDDVFGVTYHRFSRADYERL